MKTARKFAILFLWILLLPAGCGKQQAETVLLEEEKSSEEAGTEETPVSSPEPAETPVIQVICSCQCAGASSGTSAEASAQPSVQRQPEEAQDGRVNINTADAAQLQTLNGIGASRAQDIISYREEHGAFQSIEDIKNVQGIKEGIYSKIKDDISV